MYMFKRHVLIARALLKKDVRRLIVDLPLDVAVVEGVAAKQDVLLGKVMIDPALRDVALVYGANRWQTFLFVELPLALPTILSGIKIGFTLSMTGATVQEARRRIRGQTRRSRAPYISRPSRPTPATASS